MRAAAKQEEEEEQGGTEDPKLRIAWQYRRYIQRQRQQPLHSAIPAEPLPAVLSTPALAHAAGRPPPAMGASVQSPGAGSSSSSKGAMRDWAHSFDLSRGMDAGFALQGGRLTCAGHRGPEALQDLLQGARSFLAQLQQSPGASAAPAASGAPAPLQARWEHCSGWEGCSSGVPNPEVKDCIGLSGENARMCGAAQGTGVSGQAGDRGPGQRGMAPWAAADGGRGAEGHAAAEAPAGGLTLRSSGLCAGRQAPLAPSCCVLK